MSTTMKYGNYSFSPVPLFTESVETFRDPKFDQLFKRVTREFTGTLLNSVNIEASGAFQNLFTQKNQLKEALCSGNQEFQILFNGVPLVSGEFPRINGPVFQEGTWVDRIDYTFSSELDELIDQNIPVQSFTETWDFEEEENRRSVIVQHNISAVGVNTNPSGINNAFANARTFVLGKTGFANAQTNAPFFAQVSGVSFAAYEAIRSEQHDIAQGSFSAAERFTLSSGNFIHTQTSQFSTDSNGITTVTLNGNIRGLGRGDTAFDRAQNAFQNQIRGNLPADASGVYSSFGGEATIFTTNPSTFSVTRNQFAGTVDYTTAYTDSPADNLPSGILDFGISVQIQPPSRQFASFLIMERALGPVVQDVGTSNEGTYTVQGSAVGKPSFSFNDLLAFVEDKINEKRPSAANYITLRPGAQSVTRDEDNNTVQFNVSWIFTLDLSQVFGDGDAPVVIT